MIDRNWSSARGTPEKKESSPKMRSYFSPGPIDSALGPVWAFTFEPVSGLTLFNAYRAGHFMPALVQQVSS